MKIDAVDGRRGQGLGLAGGLVFVGGYPGDLFAYRGHLKIIGIQTGAFAGALEGSFMKARRTGGHHHPVEAQLADILFNHFLAGVRTHEFVVPGYDHIFQGGDELGHLLQP